MWLPIWVSILSMTSVWSQDDLDVQTKYGTLRGQFSEGIFSWKGVPYATPPLKDLRWRAPLPPPAWKGVRLATEYSKQCIQPPIPQYNSFPATSEDCLYLNIFRSPTHASATHPRAVMLYIHGGSFIVGSGSLPMYHPGNLLKRADDIIVVTINYRLGVLGFMYHPSLASDDASARGNWGMLDQIEAMRWVRENIAAFGGDPTRVTLVGQSAGGQGIYVNYFSPLTKGLFSGAIMQSGSGELTHTAIEAVYYGDIVIDTVNCNRTSEHATAKCLRSVDPTALADLALAAPWAPVVDGYYLVDEPESLLQAGHVPNLGVPFIIGSDRNDSNFLLSISMHNFDYSNINMSTVHHYLETALNGGVYNESVVQQMLSLYKPTFASFLTNFTALCHLRNHFKYVCPVHRTVERLDALTASDKFWYIWDHTPSFTPPFWNVSYVGATHTTELGFIFGHPCWFECAFYNATFTAEEVPIRHAMMDYWANFVRTGNPNNPRTPDNWPQYTRESQATLNIGKVSFVSHNEAQEAHCGFWDRLMPPVVG